MLLVMIMTSHHITIESTRDIASSRIDRKHLHTNYDGEAVDDGYEEVDDYNYEEVANDDVYDNLGASPTAVAKINAPVLDVAFRFHGKFHHLANIICKSHCKLATLSRRQKPMLPGRR